MVEKYAVQYTALGERIRLRRLEMGLTQSQLAKEVRVTGSFIGHLERAEKIPSVDTLVRICENMGMSLDYLVLGVKHECDRENCALYADLRDLLGHYTGR